jgi:hypothetical protein
MYTNQESGSMNSIDTINTTMIDSFLLYEKCKRFLTDGNIDHVKEYFSVCKVNIKQMLDPLLELYYWIILHSETLYYPFDILLEWKERFLDISLIHILLLLWDLPKEDFLFQDNKLDMILNRIYMLFIKDLSSYSDFKEFYNIFEQGPIEKEKILDFILSQMRRTSPVRDVPFWVLSESDSKKFHSKRSMEFVDHLTTQDDLLIYYCLANDYEKEKLANHPLIQNLYLDTQKSLVDCFDIKLENTFGPCNTYRFKSLQYDCMLYEDSDNKWMNGYCEYCQYKILKKEYALRRPVPYESWTGCFCSFECMINKLEEDYEKEYKEKMKQYQELLDDKQQEENNTQDTKKSNNIDTDNPEFKEMTELFHKDKVAIQCLKHQLECFPIVVKNY